ncbi:hypothetical protein ATANTOWER_026499, partial [Ataeniobius toweri]|nr:hypothetical protein [Ataeniobius toweri]
LVCALCSLLVPLFIHARNPRPCHVPAVSVSCFGFRLWFEAVNNCRVHAMKEAADRRDGEEEVWWFAHCLGEELLL